MSELKAEKATDRLTVTGSLRWADALMLFPLDNYIFLFVQLIALLWRVNVIKT